MGRPRVMLADDNPAILQHAARLLEPGFEVVASALDGETVLQEYDGMRPDIVVLDISMGKLSGLDVARSLAEKKHQCKVIFLTVHEDYEFVCAAFAAGGVGYVVKSRLNLDLLTAVHAILAGRIFVSPSLQHA